MEFDKKLQQLRKEKGWTQEQLAEKLFVSRTAVSKWESGKGYPNIESLKSISKLFSVSIDGLLSGEELVSLAEDENRTNINKVFSMIFIVLDLLVLVFLFLPLYGQQDNGFVRMVALSSLRNTSAVTRAIYYSLPLGIAALGLAEWIIQRHGSVKMLNRSKVCSISLQAFTILALIATRQPYATALMFVFFIIKIVLLAKGRNTR